MVKLLLLVFSALIIICPLLTTTALGQSSRGIIVGRVADGSDAVVIGATVKILNTQTSIVRETITTERGSFRFDAVEPGNYQVTASISSFKTLVIDNLVVAAGQTSSLNLSMVVSSTESEIVEISADRLTAVQHQNNALVSTLNAQQLHNLPISSLNPVDLVLTLPGVIAPGNLAGGFVRGTDFSINGLRPRGNNQLIDGADNNDIAVAGQSYRPALRDGFQEVLILGGNNSAEYGRTGASVANLITRSGTNAFHGSVYDIVTPSALFSLSSGQKLNKLLKSVPVSIQNQYGFSFGGPILKNRLFFFTSYQNSPFRTSATVATAVVPTADGFQQLRALFPQGSTNLDNYLNIVGDVRGTTRVRAVPLGGNRPDINFGVASLDTQQPIDNYQFLIRTDWIPTSRDNFAFRYLQETAQATNTATSLFKGFEVDSRSRAQNFQVSYSHFFSPRVTNEFRFAYGRFNTLFSPRDSAALSLPLITIATASITEVGLPTRFPQGRNFNNYQFQNTTTYLTGGHTIRVGVDLVKQDVEQLIPFNSRGTLVYTAGGGFPAFGNFVDGFSGTSGAFAAKSFGLPRTRPDAFQQNYFINDTWRVSRTLTLNFGLRYENYGTPFNVIEFPAFPGLNRPFNTRVEQQRDNNNFSPRFSFAYSPRFLKTIFGDGKTVIRGGASIGYDPLFNNILSNSAASSPNSFGINRFGSSAGGRGFANAGVETLPTSGMPSPTTTSTSIDANLRNPQIYLFNLGIQREITTRSFLDVSYVSTRGVRLLTSEQFNPAINGKRIMPTRGSVHVRTNGGDSIYHALQTGLQYKLKSNLIVNFAYTYSKVIDNTSEIFETTAASSFSADPFNRRADRSVASFDATHRTVISYTWQLPGAKRGLMGQLFGGYALSGIYRIQTGAVESPYINGIDTNGDLSAINDRPAISNPNASRNSVAFERSLVGMSGSGFVDVEGNPVDVNSCYYVVLPASLTRGAIAGRNTLRAQRANQFDLRMQKSFALPFEGHRLEFRLEFFNLFNHANFTWERDGAISDGDVTNPNFNNVRLNDGGHRTGRFELRYVF